MVVRIWLDMYKRNPLWYSARALYRRKRAIYLLAFNRDVCALAHPCFEQYELRTTPLAKM